MKKLVLMALVCILVSPNAASQSKESEPAFYLDRKAEQEHIWHRTPTVHVCIGSTLTETRVKNAMAMWGRLGYTLNGPIMKSTIPECLVYDSSPGKILIGSNTARVPADNAAVTRTWYNKYTNEIISAFIEIKPKWNTKERVVEHELGHALGWDHCNRKYHLMHSIHDLGGWDTAGLKNQQKMSFIEVDSKNIVEKIYRD